MTNKPYDITDFHAKHVCTVCSKSAEKHHNDGRCPSGNWPKWPKIKDERKAAKVYDARVAAFWSASPGKFEPKK